MRCRKASLFLRRLGVTNFVRATSPFNLARAQKSNSIPLYYNIGRASSQEKFQISFPNICAHRTYVLSNFYFCQIFIVFFCACPGRQIFSFVKFSNKLQTSCEKAAPRSCKRAANFFFFQILRSCKFYELSNFKAPAQSH